MPEPIIIADYWRERRPHSGLPGRAVNPDCPIEVEAATYDPGPGDRQMCKAVTPGHPEHSCARKPGHSGAHVCCTGGYTIQAAAVAMRWIEED